jgi:hypothetical protein
MFSPVQGESIMQDSLVLGVVMTLFVVVGASLIVVAINHTSGTKQQSEHQTAQLVSNVNFELTLPDLSSVSGPVDEPESLIAVAEAV